MMYNFGRKRVIIHMIITQEKRKSINITTLAGWFLIYSFFGWIYETLYCSAKAGHFVSRGFLIGPFIPIYGICIVSPYCCCLREVSAIYPYSASVQS
jgi:uncharacterized membrane protein